MLCYAVAETMLRHDGILFIIIIFQPIYYRGPSFSLRPTATDMLS